MRGISTKVAMACLALAITIPAVAQVRHGAVEGTVHEPGGAGLPGVTVVLSGDNMMGERTEVTGGDGSFRIQLVPPGLYSLEASLAGMQTVLESEIRVFVGSTAILDVEMTPGFEEAIQVVADQVLIDTTSSAVGTTIAGDFVAELANDRQYTGIMEMMPGVVEGEGQAIHGASSGDNIHLADGADVSSIYSGSWTHALNFDNIQDVQVLTGGVPAEFGRGTGGLVNLVTKSGSNEFHGLVRFVYSDLDWNEDMKGDSYYFDEPTEYVEERRPAFNLGGRFIRDKLWFFTSYERRNKYKPITRYETWQDAVADVHNFAKTSYSGRYVGLKLTLLANPKHLLYANYSTDGIDIEDRYAYAEYNDRTHEADVLSQQGGWTMLSDWTGMLSDSIFVNLKGNWSDKPLDRTPYTTGPCYYTSANDNLYFGGPYIEYHSPRERATYSFTYNHFVDTARGSHQLKAGIEHDGVDVGRYSEYYPGGERIRMYGGLDETDRYRDRRVYIQRRGMVRTSREIQTAFVQDTWRVTDDLTLNLGVRLESLEEQANTGEAVLDWGWSDRVQPRLGFAYNIGGNNLHGSVSRYYDIIDNGLSRAFSDVPDQIYDLYRWSRTDDDWYFYRRYVTSADLATREENLNSPYMDELTLGYQLKLSPSMALGIDATWREWKDGIEDDEGRDFPSNPADDGNYHYLNVGKTREYKGIELTLRKQRGGGNIRFLASYTLSSTEGIWSNDDENTGWGDNPYRYWNRWGPASQDHRHIVKFNGVYQLPAGFQVGANLAYYSGRPYNRYGTVLTSDDGIWDGEEFSSYYLFEKGSARMPSWWTLDLKLQKLFDVGERFTFGLYVDVFNVLDNQKPKQISGFMGELTLANDQPGAEYTLVEASDNYLEYEEWQAPRSYYAGVTLEF